MSQEINKAGRRSKASIKLRIECLHGYIAQQGIKQKADRDEVTEAKKQALKFETDLITSKTKYKK